MARPEKIDSEWPEVKHINGYVVFVVYLSSAVRGTGFLAITWTTVVLLGGFVSSLKRKDFWCLTSVTFLQIAGIFNGSMDGQLRHLRKSIDGVVAASGVVGRKQVACARPMSIGRGVVTSVQLLLGWVQITVAIASIIPFLALVMLGLLVSTIVSFCRLIERDYGGTEDSHNMHPALDVLYVLAVVQGALYGYRMILALVYRRRKRIVYQVATAYDFQDPAASSVSDYSSATLTGCMKTQSFAQGRNLITYAVDLMESKSPAEFCSGTRILGTIIGPYKFCQSCNQFGGQCILIEELIGSASSSHILQKLLEVLHVKSSSSYDGVTRQCAARIVALVAKEVRLEQFPQGIQYISSLIETFEDWYVRDCSQIPDNDDPNLRARVDYIQLLAHDLPEDDDPELRAREDPDLRARVDYIQLLAHGLSILSDLASDENNCRVIRETQGLLPKIMAPVTCDLLHRIDHPAWINIVKLSLMAMSRLVAAPRDTGAKVRQQISSNEEAISSMERILNCETCKNFYGLHIQVMEILAELSMDTQDREINFIKCREINFIKDREMNFIKVLVRIFTGVDEDSSSREMAGAALAKLSLGSISSVGFILKAIDDLNTILLDVQLQNKPYRQTAAEIVENLCNQYTTDDECLDELKIAMTAVIPTVLGEIYFPQLAGDGTHTGTDHQLPQGQVQGTDIESQHGHQQDNNQGDIPSSSAPQNNEHAEEMNNDEELNATLFSLCVTVCNTLISVDQDLTDHIYATIPGNGASSFERKLKDMVDRMRHPRPACLKMLKLTSMMVILMMKHRGSYGREELDSLMESLTTASKCMFLLDGSMIFVNGHKLVDKYKLGSLVSLVKEAQQLVDKYNPPP